MAHLDNSKFPGQPSGLPPSPTIENPGRVFPKTDPAKASFSPPSVITLAQYVGNPFLMNAALDDLDHALGHVIQILEQEDKAEDREGVENQFLDEFRSWKNGLEVMRTGGMEIKLETNMQSGRSQEGGMFTD